jgi:hypothetical protein
MGLEVEAKLENSSAARQWSEKESRKADGACKGIWISS